MKDLHTLINNVKESNLSEDDKKLLISLIEEKDFDFDKFLDYFSRFVLIGSKSIENFNPTDWFG